MNEYVRNQADIPATFPDLVYSSWLDKFFPCRIIAQSGGQVLIEAQYYEKIVPMRVPVGIVYRRPRSENGAIDPSR